MESHLNDDEQVFTPGQILVMSFGGIKMLITVQSIVLGSFGGQAGRSRSRAEGDSGAGGPMVGGRSAGSSSSASIHGLLDSNLTEITWAKTPGSALSFDGEGASGGQNMIFHGDFDFAKLGIGGLGKEFNQIFRRAFASRIVNSAIVREMGISHVRGMLLYGPPGCGKTLIARQIGKVCAF